MKKLYQEEKWKRYSKKRSNTVLQQKHEKAKEAELRRREKQKFADVTKGRELYKNIIKKKGLLTIKAPMSFSLIENPEETLQFFDSLNHYIRNVKEDDEIYLDLSEIKDLTTDAILYILSSLEYGRHHNFKVKISGNNPVDDKCNKIFANSGFYKYVYSKKRGPLHADPDTLSIESGSLVVPGKAADTKEFTKRSLMKDESKDTKSIYTTLIECMGNTRQHAYKKGSGYAKWWLMASYDKESVRVHFTFLDNGYGIPSTIRMRFGEKIRSVFGKIVGEVPDSGLILSALNGEFRTRTGIAYRGKGLPSIFETARNKKIDNLIVISKKGYVGWKKSEKGELESIELKFPLFGTLLSWDIL